MESQVLAADGVVRQLRMPQIDPNLETGVLGVTMLNGDVFIRAGLPREQQISTLLHESVHSFLSVGDGEFLASFRQGVSQFLYNNSAFFQGTEEIIAESYASGSLRAGLAHAFSGAYLVRGDITVTAWLYAKEAAVVTAALGSLGTGGYSIGQDFGSW